jgi:hypothetical protein
MSKKKIEKEKQIKPKVGKRGLRTEPKKIVKLKKEKHKRESIKIQALLFEKINKLIILLADQTEEKHSVIKSPFLLLVF